MNPVWVTQSAERTSSDPKQIEADWAAGNEFRVYQFAKPITVAMTHDLLLAGFTHLRVVYQMPDLSVRATDIDLRKHLRKGTLQ